MSFKDNRSRKKDFGKRLPGMNQPGTFRIHRADIGVVPVTSYCVFPVIYCFTFGSFFCYYNHVCSYLINSRVKIDSGFIDHDGLSREGKRLALFLMEVARRCCVVVGFFTKVSKYLEPR